MNIDMRFQVSKLNTNIYPDVLEPEGESPRQGRIERKVNSQDSY